MNGKQEKIILNSKWLEEIIENRRLSLQGKIQSWNNRTHYHGELYQFTFPSICVIEDTIEVGIILYVHLYPYKDSKNSDVILKTT